MADPESLREIAHSRVPFSTWVGVVLLFALFGVIVLAIVGPSPRGDDYERKRATAREEKLKTLREEDAKALTTYGWIDKNKGIARVPVDRAMQLTIAELAQKKPAPAGPIATPEPQASATPASTAAPAASPKPASVSRPSAGTQAQPAPAVIKPSPGPMATATASVSPPAAQSTSAAPSPGKTP